MPVQDIVILSLIVTAFTTFAAVLGGVSWYCRDKRKREYHRDGRDRYPTGGALMTDDD